MPPAPAPVFTVPTGSYAPANTPNGGTISHVYPSEAPDIGGVPVIVNGNNFVDKPDLRCNFGSRSIVAEFVSSTQVRCAAPQHKLKTEETGLPVNFWLSGGGEVSTNQEFLFHATLLVSDVKNNAVHAFDAHNGGFSKTIIASGSGGLSNPQGIQFSDDMSIFVASAGSNQILKYNSNGHSLGVFTELPKNCGPRDILFGPDSNLFVACSQLNKVIAFNANSGQQLGIAAQGGGLAQPTAIAFGPGNTLYVISSGSHKLLRYAQGGYFQGAVQKLESASDVAFFKGNIFTVGGGDEHSVQMLSGGSFVHYVESDQLRQSAGMVFDVAGELYVAANNRILRFTNRGQYSSSMKAGVDMQASFMAISPRETKRLGGGSGGHNEL